jgi:hypothetical protein
MKGPLPCQKCGDQQVGPQRNRTHSKREVGETDDTAFRCALRANVPYQLLILPPWTLQAAGSSSVYIGGSTNKSNPRALGIGINASQWLRLREMFIIPVENMS